ncbi:10296_t:CDS:2, partial [Scutellospora calospora]
EYKLNQSLPKNNKSSLEPPVNIDNNSSQELDSMKKSQELISKIISNEVQEIQTQENIVDQCSQVEDQEMIETCYNDHEGVQEVHITSEEGFTSVTVLGYKITAQGAIVQYFWKATILKLQKQIKKLLLCIWIKLLTENSLWARAERLISEGAIRNSRHLVTPSAYIKIPNDLDEMFADQYP